jgi:hypothetical protein
MTSPKTLDHLPVFEKLGEAQVRLQFIDRTDDVGREARSWLHELQLQRDLEASAKRDAREEETLSIAREALSNSNRANIIAISAIIFSVITAAIIAWYTVKYGN